MPLLGHDTLRVDIDGCVVDHNVDGPNRVHLIRYVLGLGSAREISDNQARRSIDEVHHAAAGTAAVGIDGGYDV